MTKLQSIHRHYWDVSDVHLTRRIQSAGAPGNHRKRTSYLQGFCLRYWGNRAFIWLWRRP